MSSNKVFVDALKYGALLAIGIALVGGVIGFFLDGSRGVVSALIGTALSAVMLAITAASILFANRFYGSDLFVGAFFGIVLGGWLLKFVVFLVLVFLLADQPWVNRVIMLVCVIVGVIGSLVVDMVVVARSRVGYVSDAQLPGDQKNAQ
ncbi:hypothetical protein ALI44B_15210 [Leifsonia sp. ALI-44-B]|uniref:hypothetical protein n=1 Tax=Leifsonia sp. ALI-44-B TaxID=1933776 RepID=UPI00097CA5EB|nr:hypothetical protein [Leifsonia sp. ALI-44-B]ONI61707.1 hypothetical protein ALI44B_15210 [Leifsonia sp. ALI-44-B]